jgi:hypothetical protein
MRRQRDRLRRHVCQRHGQFAALNALDLLRVSKAGEIEGLDVDQHGITAYPEYEMSGAAPRKGMSAEMG